MVVGQWVRGEKFIFKVCERFFVSWGVTVWEGRWRNQCLGLGRGRCARMRYNSIRGVSLRTYRLLAAAFALACITEMRALNVCVMANLTVAQIRGAVQDTSRQPVSNARVELLAGVDHNPVANAIADTKGAFAFAHVKPGWYWLTVSSPGFSRIDAHIQVPARRSLLYRRSRSLVVPLGVGSEDCVEVRLSTSVKKGTKARH